MASASTTTEPNQRLPAVPAERVRDRLLARLRARRLGSASAAGTPESLRARLREALGALEPDA